jgi:hypothetical protein
MAPAGIIRAFRLYFHLRHVYRLREDAGAGEGTSFRLYEAPSGLLERLLSASRSRGVTVHDAFVAALTAALAEITPARRAQRRRRGLAVTTIADVRVDARADLSRAFGMYLGQATFIALAPDCLALQDLLGLAAGFMRRAKENGRFRGGDWSLRLLFFARKWLPFRNARAWYRKVYPISAGLSNVKLERSWFGAAGNEILEYIRVAPTGPAVPLVLTPTTFDGKLNVSVVWRRAALSEAQVERLMELFSTALGGLGGA